MLIRSSLPITILLLLRTIQGLELQTTPLAEELERKVLGKTVIVTCSIAKNEESVENVELNWYRGDKQIPREGRIFTYPRNSTLYLMFMTPTLQDSGEYSCMAQQAQPNQQDQRVLQKKTLKIQFITKPTFVDPQTEQHPEVGLDAKIQCRVTGETEIFWKFNDKVVKEGGPIPYKLEEGGQVLHIKNYNAERNDGIYECFLTMDDHFETLAINVTGYVKPTLSVFHRSDDNKPAYESQPVQLVCQASGKPVPTYRIFRKTSDGEDEELTESDRYDFSDGVLKIETLMPSDAGNYTCVATNPLASVQESMILEVFRKPKVKKIESQTKTVGDDVELRCDYDGDGKIDVHWVHQGEVYAAERPEEEAEATTEGAEVDENDDRDKYENTGDEENAQDVAHEVQKRSENDYTDSRISVREEGKSLVLSISNVKMEDAGEFQCVAKNEAGDDYRIMTLLIAHAPEVTAGEPVRQVQGKATMMLCQASAVPEPEWTWYGPKNVQIIPDEIFQIRSANMTTKLIILLVKPEHYGTYRCSATNKIGEDSRTVNLSEIVTPKTPTEVNCKSFLYPNYAECKIADYPEADERQIPTRLTFLYAKEGEELEGEGKNVTVQYNEDMPEGPYEITGLEPNTRYTLKIIAENAAGASDFSEDIPMETSEPKAPLKSENISHNCTQSQTCFLTWDPPNDMGAPITAYRIKLLEYDPETREFTDKDSKVVEVDVSKGEQTDLSGFDLKPSTKYRVLISAVNAEGEGQPGEKDIETPGWMIGESQALGWGTTNFALAIGFILLFLLFVIDLICFATNRCGLIACFCTRCLGRDVRGSREKDVEQGNRSETNRLLSEGKMEPRGPTNRNRQD